MPDGEDPHAATAWVLELLQTWLTATALEDARLVVLTKGALPARDAEQANLAHAAVPGLVRSAAMEDPLRFALIDLAPAGDFDPRGLDVALATTSPSWRCATARSSCRGSRGSGPTRHTSPSPWTPTARS